MVFAQATLRLLHLTSPTEWTQVSDRAKELYKVWQQEALVVEVGFLEDCLGRISPPVDKY
jgi:hypothetical protein